MKDIAEFFPIADIQDGKFLNSAEAVSIAFELTYPEVFLQTKEEYNDLQEKLSLFIKQLPDYTIYQTISLFDEESFTDGSDYENETFIQRHSKLYYTERRVPTEKQYIILTFANRELASGISTHSITNTLKYLLKNPYESYDSDRRKIDTYIANAATSLHGIFDEYTGLKRLSDEEIELMLYRYFSLDYNCPEDTKNMRLPNYNFKSHTVGDYNLGVVSLYEGRRADSFMRARQTQVSVVDSKIKQVSEIGNISQSQMFPMTIGLPFKHAYCVVIQKLNIDDLFGKFFKEEKALSIPKAFGLSQAVNKLNDIEIFKDCCHNEGYTPTLVSMAVIIPEKNPNKMDMKIEATRSAAGKIFEMRPLVEKEEIELTFLAHSPGNGTSSYKNSLSTSIHSASYVPKESHYKSDLAGIPFSDRYGNKILVDIHNNRHMNNKNGVILGPSGGGKSFTLNYILSRMYDFGHVFIIDKGDSYKRLCDTFNGEYLDCKNEELFRFAIFETVKDMEGKYLVSDLHKSFVLATILFVWKQGTKAAPEERRMMERHIEQYYDFVNKEKVRPSFTGFYDFVDELGRNATAQEKLFFSFESFHLMAAPYVHEGADAMLLNSDANLDLTDVKFIVFEMGSIADSNPIKFNLLCIIITFLNLKKVKLLPRHIFKTFLIDEALSFLKGDMGDYIGKMYAEIRKENGQVLVVAQSLTFLEQADPEVQEKIFANRDFILLTSHQANKNSYPVLMKKLGFTEKDIELLDSIIPKQEVFVKLGTHPMILRIDASLEETALFTTKPEEMKTMVELEAIYDSVQTAALVFAQQKRYINQNKNRS